MIPSRQYTEGLINFYTSYDDEKDPNGKYVLIGCTGEIFEMISR